MIFWFSKNTCMVVGGCALANHALGSRTCMYWWMWVIPHNATILQSKTYLDDMMRRGAACQACPLQGDRRHSNQARGHKKLVLGMISTRISGIPTNPFAIGVLGKPWPVPTNGARLKPNAASKSPKAKPPQPQALKPPHSYRQMPGL